MIRLLIALAFLIGVAGSAHAVMYADQGMAYAGCLAETRALNAPSRPESKCEIEGIRYYRGFRCATGGSGCGLYGIHEWPANKACSDRNGDGDGPPTSQNAILVGSGGVCYNGCAYGAPLGEATSHWSFSGGQTITYVEGGSRVPTGAVCDAGGGEYPDPQEEYCETIGDLTQCLQKDGRHCAVSSSGRRFCWRPEETGTKVSGNEAATKSPQGVGINPPPVPPKNNGEWQQTGTGTTSVSSGGTTNNYNVTNNTSNYGPDGEGGGAEGDGEGDGDGEEGDNPGEGVGTLYERTDKTIGSLLTDFYNQLTGTQVMQSITNFMQADGGGSCPVFTLAASEFWNSMTVDMHCSGAFYAFLQACGWVIFAMAAYIAVKIALT